ncbi:MAG: OmpA family protein [Sandaracinaceae bacterium]
MRRLQFGLAVIGASLLSAGWPSAVRAQERWLLSVDGGVLWSPAAPTAGRFGPGGAGAIGLYRSLSDAFLLGARLQAGILSDGPAPEDPTLDDPGLGDVETLSLVLRVRPLAPAGSGPRRGSGLFLEAGGGGGLTGGLVRPAGEAGAGFLFGFGAVALGPAVRYAALFETSNQLEGRPAQLLWAGVELVLLDASNPPPLPPVPPSDRDGDGLVDDEDRCPDEAEDADGFRDEDGCPDPDNDADGILDVDDLCPLAPEDPDGFEDDDGCPDPDNDGDGFPDERDACPDEAEVVNGIDDQDGCPDQGLIEMIDDRIVLEERVLFDFGRARVKSRARPVLEAIVNLYRQHPEWTQVRIEGHADVRGTPRFNQRLSELRAQQVRRWLVRFGIPGDAIDAVGYGETRPRAWGQAEHIHQANRRVEFVVLSRREVRRVVSPGPSGGDVEVLTPAREGEAGDEEGAPPGGVPPEGAPAGEATPEPRTLIPVSPYGEPAARDAARREGGP